MRLFESLSRGSPFLGIYQSVFGSWVLRIIDLSSTGKDLGEELAGEGAGEEGRREPGHLTMRLHQPKLKLVGQGEQARHKVATCPP